MPTLDWLNRAEALTVADKVPYRVLDPVSGHGDGNAENLLIQGDNLDALKALLPFYRGRVKCIFIDPPYNTKSAFEHYDDNLEHSQWLSMMYPRLVLLRELLAEDGSIWVTIDDNEGHYLKVLMDEVFGRGNFKTTVTWQRKYSVSNNFQGIATICDFVHVYAKSDRFQNNLLPRSEESVARYNNPDNDPRGPWKAVDYLNQATPGKRPNLCYDIVNPNTGDVVKNIHKAWKYDPSTHNRHIEENRIWWGRDGRNTVPALKLFLSDVRDGMTPHNWWPHEEVGHTDEAKKEMIGLYGASNVFDTPKPERLLQRIIHIATNTGDLVLDSFLGSGTTAAVAHKMGRRWIGIEMGEHAETHCLPRLQKVIEGEQGGISEAVNWQGGGGFRFLRLGEPMFDADGSIHPAVRFTTLASFVWMQETGHPFEIPPSPPFAKGGVAGNIPRTEEERTSKSTLKKGGGLGRQDHTSNPTLKKGGGAAGGITPLLGVHEDRAIYLLFNGILGDKRPASGNVLTNEVLAAINRICPHDGPKIIYGEACRLGAARLAAAGVTFKHIPYDVKAR